MREAGGTNPASEAPAADPAAGQDEPKFKIGKFELSESQVESMMERQAQEDLRVATRPATPADYKLELSAGAKLPGEVDFKFDASNPGLAALKNWAHAKGFDQSTLSEMLTIYATHEAQQNAVLVERARQEIAKAGANGPQRVDAVHKFITAEMGEADARPIRASLVTDAHLRFYERMMNKISSQGSASFSQQHRVPAEDRGIPGYDKMSFAEKRHAQDQRSLRTSR